MRHIIQMFCFSLAVVLFFSAFGTAGLGQDGTDGYDDAVEQVRAALSGMDPDTAVAALAEAKPLAQTEEQKLELRRLEEVAPLLEAYLSWISQISANCTLTEIKLNDTTFVSVVETTAAEITVRAAGKNKTYTIPQLSPRLVRILVDGIYDKSPDNKAIYGAFEAFHPKGDRDLARQLWEQAGKSGLNTAALIPELDVPRVPPLVSLPGQENRMPVPSQEEVEQGIQAVMQRFSKQIDKAQADPMKEKLALLLLKTAGKDKKLTPAQRFALLNYIEQLGQDLSKPGISCEALTIKTNLYKTNTFRKRMKLVLGMTAETKPENIQLAQASGALLQECGLTNRWDDAQTLIPIVKKSAAAGGVGAMMKLAKQAEEYLAKTKR